VSRVVIAVRSTSAWSWRLGAVDNMTSQSDLVEEWMWRQRESIATEEMDAFVPIVSGACLDLQPDLNSSLNGIGITCGHGLHSIDGSSL
jgi:hypothetical protein